MKQLTQHTRLFLKAILIFSFFWIFCLPPIYSKDPFDFDYFLSLLDQIESRSYFKPPDETWFSKGLKVFPYWASLGPVTKQVYTHLIDKEILESPQNEGHILRQALKGLILALGDPYAAFLTPREVATEETQKSGKSYSGFGLLFSQKKDAVEIAGTLPHSPAEHAGISPGDFIVTVNGKPFHRLGEVIAAIHPESGHPLLLGVKHDKKLIRYRLSPATIQMIPFLQKQLHKAGYIAMEVIVPGNDLKFLSAVKSFEKNGDPYLILDLRDCIGGELSTAARIAGYLLQTQDIIYYQETTTRRTAYTNATSAGLTIPVYILTNQATASAAELISAALQEHKRATVIGETSVGKGTIQTTWILKDGGAMRFTTAVYLTPSQKKVVGLGVTPDILHAWKRGESDEALESLVEKFRDVR